MRKPIKGSIQSTLPSRAMARVPDTTRPSRSNPPVNASLMAMSWCQYLAPARMSIAVERAKPLSSLTLPPPPDHLKSWYAPPSSIYGLLELHIDRSAHC